MHAQGRCKFGDKCHFSHKGGSRSASPKAKPKGKARPKAKPSAAAPLAVAAPAARLAVTFASVIASVKCFDPAQPLCSGAGVSTPPAAPAAGRADYDYIERRWLMDTGCGYDLVCKTSLQDLDFENVNNRADAILLQTANGPAQCTQTVPQQIGPLGVQADPYVLESTPDVLTIGYRCEALGYGFYWEPYSSTPILVKPSGRQIHLQSEHYVPYLYDYDICPPGTGTCASAPSAAAAGLPAPSCIRSGGRPAPPRAPAAVDYVKESNTSDDEPCGLVESSDDSDDDEDSDTELYWSGPVESSSGGSVLGGLAAPAADVGAESDADDEGEDGAPEHVADEGEEDEDEEHDLTTHEPKSLQCQVCLDAKTQRKSRMRGGLAMGPRPKCFGDQCTGDHLFSKAAVENADPFFPLASTAVVMHDRATKWLDCFPKATKSHNHTVEAFHEWSGNKRRIKSFYCDNSHELLGAARTVGWCCPTATPGVPQSNGLAE
ncbi:MAG: hypothetical protein GY701_34620, partial [Sulfitobacter sp.]|nr:hypothetical protein [Sulfitobacter sp.]